MRNGSHTVDDRETYSPFFEDDRTVDDSEPATAPRKPSRRQFVYVPLDDDWGYRAVAAAGNGAVIVLYALYRRRVGGCTEVAISAAMLRRLGVTRKVRTHTLDRLVEGGFATVRHRGKFRGCPLLTLKPPPEN